MKHPEEWTTVSRQQAMTQKDLPAEVKANPEQYRITQDGRVVESTGAVVGRIDIQKEREAG